MAMNNFLVQTLLAGFESPLLISKQRRRSDADYHVKHTAGRKLRYLAASTIQGCEYLRLTMSQLHASSRPAANQAMMATALQG
jgi:hypothetical protein